MYFYGKPPSAQIHDHRTRRTINNCKNINHTNLIENRKQAKNDKDHIFRKYERLFYTKCRVTSNGFMCLILRLLKGEKVVRN